ncbi:MAG: hypothetical protein RLZZ230_82 [Candidatus Parcubacteria bacterium]|jgi:hypothetical protein
MDTVVLDGVLYVKASVIAKRFKYTSDYVGQLCRGKKVDARLVGRSWFVNPDSIQEHKDNKFITVTQVEHLSSEISSNIKPQRVDVFPEVTARVHKSFPVSPIKITSDKSRKLKISYEIDDEFLIPKLIKKHYQPAKSIRIDQADAYKINVGGKQNLSTFTPTAIPDVALSGKLTVTTFPDVPKPESESEANTESKVETETSDNHINKVISELVSKIVAPKVDDKPKRKGLTLFKRKTSMVNIVPRKMAIVFPPMSESIKTNVPNPLPTTPPEVKNEVLTPLPEFKNIVTVIPEPAAEAFVKTTAVAAVVDNLPIPIIPQILAIPEVVAEMSFLVRVSPLIATVLALFAVLMLLSATNFVVAGDVTYRSFVTLDFQTLLQMLHL